MGKKHLGFTIVEILVVVAVIGILATLVMVSVGKSKAKARDAQRKADLKTMSTALGLYKDENKVYPGANINTDTWTRLAQCGGTTTNLGATKTESALWTDLQTALSSYLTILPQDPKQKCSTTSQFMYNPTGYTYNVARSDLSISYTLWAYLEVDSDTMNNSKGVATLTYASGSDLNCATGKYYDTAFDYYSAWCGGSGGRSVTAFRQSYAVGGGQ